MSRQTVLVSAAILIDQAGRILLAQRPPGRSFSGMWEFPGGKVESGESPEEALCRELKEELSVSVQTEDLWAYRFVSHAYDDFHLVMVVYSVRKWEGEVIPLEGQRFSWVKPADLLSYPTPPADLPLFKLLASGGAAYLANLSAAIV